MESGKKKPKRKKRRALSRKGSSKISCPRKDIFDKIKWAKIEVVIFGTEIFDKIPVLETIISSYTQEVLPVLL